MMKKNSWISQILMLAGLMLLVLFGFFVLGSGKGTAEHTSAVLSVKQPTPSKTYRPGEEERKQEIERLKTLVADEKLPPKGKSSLQTRIPFAERQATNLAKPSNPHPFDETATPDPVNDKGGEEYPDGFIRGIPVPWGADRYTIKTVWKAKSQKEKVLIYAGARTKDKDQGIVIIRILKDSQDFFYPTPKKAGVLTMTGYDGQIAQFVSEQGETFQFDVTNGRYLGYPDPTVTPTYEPVVIPLSTSYP